MGSTQGLRGPRAAACPCPRPSQHRCHQPSVPGWGTQGTFLELTETARGWPGAVCRARGQQGTASPAQSQGTGFCEGEKSAPEGTCWTLRSSCCFSPSLGANPGTRKETGSPLSPPLWLRSSALPPSPAALRKERRWRCRARMRRPAAAHSTPSSTVPQIDGIDPNQPKPARQEPAQLSSWSRSVPAGSFCFGGSPASAEM